MLLGAIMTQLGDDKIAREMLLAAGGISLVTDVQAARLLHEESVGEYISGATQRFTRLASNEDWLRLMTAIESSENPAVTSLAIMVRWSVARDVASGQQTLHSGCTCGGGTGGCHGQA